MAQPKSPATNVGSGHPRSLTGREASLAKPSLRKSFYLEKTSIARSLEAVAPLVRRGRLLDVGCGMKPYRALLASPGDQYIGIDYPLTMVHSYGAATCADVFANSLQLPFLDEIFDTVISTQLLEHVPDPQRCIHEMVRVLKPKGRLLLSAPMTWPLHEEPNDFFRYTIYGLRHLLSHAHCTAIAEHQRGGGWPTFGQMALDWLLEGRPNHSFAWKVYSSLLALVVNSSCLIAQKIFRKPKHHRLCLGWTIVAEKN